MWQFDDSVETANGGINPGLDKEYHAFEESVKTLLGVHGHCLSCYTELCTNDAECPIAACALGCGARMHACKLNEHEEHVCQLAVVRCLNAEFGCPVRLPRHRRGEHLLHCPASIIVCPRKWCRKTRASVEVRNPLPVPGNARESLSLAVHFAFGDQRELNNLASSYEAEEVSYPPPPLSDDEDDLDDDDFHPSVRKGPFYQLPQPMRYVWTHHRTRDNGYRRREMHQLMQNVRASPTSLFLDLDICAECLWEQHFFDRKIMVYCGQDFRRDEFSEHYGGLHTDVQLAVGEYVCKACPLQQYGCNVEVSRLNPQPCGSSLRYDLRHDTFALDHGTWPKERADNSLDSCQGEGDVSNDQLCNQEHSQLVPAMQTQMEELALYGYETEEEWAPLLSLPPEVLEMVLQFLDALSLRQLSCVCHQLRQVCFNFLVPRGMVVHSWKKVVDHLGRRWVLSQGKVWSFSTASAVSRNGWYWTDEAFTLTPHLSTCAHFERCDHIQAAKHVHQWKETAQSVLRERKESTKLSAAKMKRLEREMRLLWCQADHTDS